MSVNGIELKEGQIWLDANGGKRILIRDNKHPRFPWKGKLLENDEWNTYDNDGLYYGDTPSMIDLTTLISEKEDVSMKFNPKPGDKIICNNGKEFICCTLEFLQEKIGYSLYSSKSIFGYNEDCNGWQDWNDNGCVYFDEDSDYKIREVIPQSSEVPDDKKEEPMYTVEEVLEAIQIVTPSAAPWNWVHEIKEHLNKVKDPQYMEYLRLKAIYE